LNRAVRASAELLFGVLLSVLALLALPSAANAQANLTWDVNGAAASTGGAGTWNTATPIWFNGTSFVPWTNGSFNNAIFGGTAGTVTVSATIDVHNITFNTAGYTLAGVTPTIVGAGTINSVIAGTAGLTAGGTTATVTLSAANTFTGPLIIVNGNGNNLITGTVTLAPGGSLATSIVRIGNTSGPSGQPAVLQNRADNQLPNATVTFDGFPGRYAYWDLLGTTQSVVGIVDSSTAGVIEGTDSQIGIGASTLVLTGAGTYAFNGTMRNTFNGSGAIALVKNGSGTQTLSGSNIN
jgi:hypothetical protein